MEHRNCPNSSRLHPPSLSRAGAEPQTFWFKKPSHLWLRALAYPLPFPPSVGLTACTLGVEELKHSGATDEH